MFNKNKPKWLAVVAGVLIFYFGFYSDSHSEKKSSSTVAASSAGSAKKYLQVMKRIRVCDDVKCKKMTKGVLKPGVVFRVVQVNPRSYRIELSKSKNHYYLLRRDYGSLVRLYHPNRSGQSQLVYGDHRFSVGGSAAGAIEGSAEMSSVADQDNQSEASSMRWLSLLLLLLLAPGLNFSAIIKFYQRLSSLAFEKGKALFSSLLAARVGGDESDAFDDDDEAIGVGACVGDDETGLLKSENPWLQKAKGFFVAAKSFISVQVEQFRESKYAIESELNVEDTAAHSSAPIVATKPAPDGQSLSESLLDGETILMSGDTVAAPVPTVGKESAHETGEDAVSEVDKRAASGAMKVAELEDQDCVDDIHMLAETLLAHRIANGPKKPNRDHVDGEATAIIEFPEFAEFTNTGVQSEDLETTNKITYAN